MEEKKWYQSKTMIVNGVVAGASLLDVVLSNAGVIGAVLPGVAPWIAVLSALNMFLRAITTSPLVK